MGPSHVYSNKLFLYSSSCIARCCHRLFNNNNKKRIQNVRFCHFLCYQVAMLNKIYSVLIQSRKNFLLLWSDKRPCLKKNSQWSLASRFVHIFLAFWRKTAALVLKKRIVEGPTRLRTHSSCCPSLTTADHCPVRRFALSISNQGASLSLCALDGAGRSLNMCAVSVHAIINIPGVHTHDGDPITKKGNFVMLTPHKA